MNITYVTATSELKQRMKQESASNASDFIRFEDNYFSIVALDGGTPIGLIVAKKRHLSKPMEKLEEAFIDIIEVHPDYQRQGIGTVLMEKVMAWAKENDVVQIRAWSEEIRYEALMLWAKLGFTFSQVDFQREDEKHYGFYVAKRL